MKLAIQVSEETSSFDIAPGQIRWCGRSDPDADAPILVWELAAPDATVLRAFVELDPDALGEVASTLPMPTGLLADLAVRCIDHASSDPVHRALREEQALAIARSDVDTDVRWARALAQAWIDRGVPARAIPEVAVEVLVPKGDNQIRHVSALADGHVVALVLGPHAALHVYGATGSRRHPLPYDGVAWIELLRALDTELEDPSTVVLAAYHHGERRVAIAVVDLDLRVQAYGGGPLQTSPRHASRSTDAIWLHCESEHVRFPMRAVTADAPIDLATALAHPTHDQPLARFERGLVASTAPITSRRWLLRFVDLRSVPGHGPVADSLAWISLDDGHSTTLHPWGIQIVQLVRERGGPTLWATTHHGLYRLEGGEPPVLVWKGMVNGATIDREANTAWLGLANEPVVLELDLATGAERWRTTLPHAAFKVRVAAGGILAASSSYSWLDRQGAILMTSEERRDTAFAELADGTAAASSGEQVAIVTAEGELRRCAPLFDGNLAGATVDRFVFGPIGGGYFPTHNDALVAFDRTGRRTATVAWPDQSVVPHLVAFSPTHAYLADSRGLVRFDPTGPVDERPSVSPPPPRRKAARGELRHGPDTHNPRDDFPEIGIEILHSSFLAIGCNYGGSEGVYSEVPIRIGDGAIVTLVDCDLIRGSSGSVVQRASTLILVRCKLPSNLWKLGHRCHLVVIDCSVAALRIEPGPGSSVVVSGSPVVREGDYWRIG